MLQGKAFVFLFLLLLSCDFLSLRAFVDSNLLGLARQGIIIIVLCYCIPILFNKKSFFRKEYILLYLSLVSCAISSSILYGQSYLDSIKVSLPYFFGWSFYLLALRFKLGTNTIFKVLLLYSIFYTLIEMVQQLTYPIYWFCGRIEAEGEISLENRMGLWRFTLDGLNICILCFTLIFHRVISNKGMRIKNIILLLFVFIGIVFSVARKDIYACMLAMGVGIFFTKGRYGVLSKFFLAIIVASIVVLSFNYMTDLNEQAVAELDNEDFVRFVAMKFFFFDMNSSPIYYLFGAGVPNHESELGKTIEYLSEVFGYFQTDVGVVGYMSKVGLFGLLPYFMIAYKILRNWRFVDVGLLLYLFVLIMIGFFDFWGNRMQNIAAFSIFLYLVEMSIRDKRTRVSLVSRRDT